MNSHAVASGLILGIETSCDETAAAVVKDGALALSSVIYSQQVHSKFGGVVPELAGREHERRILTVIRQAIDDAGLKMAKPQIDAVAVTTGPGLAGALMVGVAAAKALSLAWGIPIVGVNHLEGHLFAVHLEQDSIAYPSIMLLVSGGHTMIVLVEEPGKYRVVGQSLDDAAGEAFDKVARFLGLGYPGGPEIEREAEFGDPKAVRFPRALRDGSFNFSFSGLKTAVVTYAKRNADVGVSDIAASFEDAVVDILVEKTLNAAKAFGAHSVALAGGVGANTRLRTVLTSRARTLGVAVYIPSRQNCTDNGAMIAAAGAWRLENFGPSDLGLGAYPSLALP
ncbi:MAG: tRNA (adenosine(37)-N6)-threonylcarbamoyltransferase complex transferase subunit TsaD [Actinomycetota bacterium]|nr:MAG: tRNA (adenosine(37)-N6)-threonylcarbamoyltransferase complex transferase subunit TsaD [Actinomycetota bacterium]